MFFNSTNDNNLYYSIENGFLTFENRFLNENRRRRWWWWWKRKRKKKIVIKDRENIFNVKFLKKFKPKFNWIFNWQFLLESILILNSESLILFEFCQDNTIQYNTLDKITRSNLLTFTPDSTLCLIQFNSLDSHLIWQFIILWNDFIWDVKQFFNKLIWCD